MKASDWNRIEAGVPEMGQLCVVRWCGYDGVEYLVGEFEEYNYQRGVFGFSCGERFALLRDVTHWLPIVEPKID